MVLGRAGEKLEFLLPQFMLGFVRLLVPRTAQLAVWWIAMFLEGAILCRSLFTKMALKYPLFYTYVAVVLAVDLARFIVYTLHPSAWTMFYWSTQFVSVLVGYAVILEILKQALDPYRGAERFGRYLVLGIFALTFAFVAFRSATRPNWSPAATTVELERDLRAVQVVVLMAILAVIFYFRIVIGRNLKGIIVGYGFFIGINVTNLAFRSYIGSGYHPVWEFVKSYSYVASLIVWAVALWSYQPNPGTDSQPRSGPGYHNLASETRGALDSMRSHLGRAAR